MSKSDLEVDFGCESVSLTMIEIDGSWNVCDLLSLNAVLFGWVVLNYLLFRVPGWSYLTRTCSDYLLSISTACDIFVVWSWAFTLTEVAGCREWLTSFSKRKKERQTKAKNDIAAALKEEKLRQRAEVSDSKSFWGFFVIGCIMCMDLAQSQRCPMFLKISLWHSLTRYVLYQRFLF